MASQLPLQFAQETLENTWSKWDIVSMISNSRHSSFKYYRSFYPVLHAECLNIRGLSFFPSSLNFGKDFFFPFLDFINYFFYYFFRSNFSFLLYKWYFEHFFFFNFFPSFFYYGLSSLIIWFSLSFPWKTFSPFFYYRLF